MKWLFLDSLNCDKAVLVRQISMQRQLTVVVHCSPVYPFLELVGRFYIRASWHTPTYQLRSSILQCVSCY